MVNVGALAAVLVAASVVRAETITLVVGGARLWSTTAAIPRVIPAKKGDIVAFLFAADESGSMGNHSIVQTSADKPCSPLAGGFSSPLNLVNGNTYEIEITDDTVPIYYACGSTNPDLKDDHCQKGEVGVINPSMSSTDSAETYDSDLTNWLVELAATQPHDPAMDNLPVEGSPIGSGINARVFGTFSRQPGGYSLPPNIYPPAATSAIDYQSPSAVPIPGLVSGNAGSSSTLSSVSASLGTAGVVGLVIASIALVGVIIALVVLFWRRRNAKKRKTATDMFGFKVERAFQRMKENSEKPNSATTEVQPKLEA